MVSFDIYDTLITRITYTPQGVFYLIQDMLKKYEYFNVRQEAIGHFAIIRIGAEKRAREIAKDLNKDEVTLKDIYNVLQSMTGFTDERIDFLIKKKIEVEKKSTIGIKKNIKVLKKYVNCGERVVLISDMYLDSVVLNKILTQVDPIFNDIPIYVSCEYGCTKTTGKLYLNVKENENVKFSEWIHYGDNQFSDVCVPQAMGIRAKNVKTVFIQYDKYISNKIDRYSLDYQLMMGAYKVGVAANSHNYTEQVGACVGGTILYPYVSWIITNCINRGIDRVYFIARDGYILKKIADIIIQRNGFHIQTKYIYGSRKAWRISENDKEKWDFLLEYIDQEIDMSNDHYAFVDINGTGYTFSIFVKAMNTIHQTTATIFYYGMNAIASYDNSNFIIYSSLKDAHYVELLCRAPEAAVCGYKKVDTTIMPQFIEKEQMRWKSTAVEAFNRGVEKFSDILSTLENELTYRIDGYELSNVGAESISLVRQPILDKYIGELPHTDSGNEEEEIFAPELRYKELKQIIIQSDLTAYNGNDLRISEYRTAEKIIQKVIDEKKKYLNEIKERYYAALLDGRIKGKKVIIYGAGAQGQKTVKEIMLKQELQIVCWVDINYKKYTKAIIPVHSPRDVLNYEYDNVLITLKNKELAQTAICILVEMGIPAKKIFSMGLQNFKIIFWGAGKKGIEKVHALDSFGITPVALCDNNANRIDKEVNNILVVGPNKINANITDYVILVTCKDSKSIQLQLEQMGADQKKVFFCDDIISYTTFLKKYSAQFFMLHVKKSIKTNELSKGIIFDMGNGMTLGGVEVWSCQNGTYLTSIGYNVQYLIPEVKEGLFSIDKDKLIVTGRLGRVCLEQIIYNILSGIMSLSSKSLFYVANFAGIIIEIVVALKQLSDEMDIKIIAVTHNDEIAYYQKYVKYKEQIEKILYISIKQKKIYENYGIEEKKLKYLQWKIPCEPVLRREWSSAAKPIRIGYAGRITIIQKRADLLITIAKKIKEIRIDFVMNIAGEGDYEEELIDQIEKNNLGDSVHFLGLMDRTQIDEFWLNQDIMIGCSEWEGRSISKVEAMAYGAVPIVTDTSGARDDIIHGENGYIVPIGDIESIIEYVDYLYKNRDKLRDMGEKAHNSIIKNMVSDEKIWKDVF